MRRSGQFKPSGQDPRRGKGGARPGAGRPSKEKIAIITEMKRMVEEHLSMHVGAVLNAALKISTGVKRKKFHPRTGKAYFEIEYDGAMIRDWIAKFVPDAPARQAVDITHGTPEEFYRAVAAAKRNEKSPPGQLPGNLVTSETGPNVSVPQGGGHWR